MPKKREQNTRKPNSRFFILCEGAKTEPNYFRDLLRHLTYPGHLVEIILIDTNKNTCRELVKEGKKVRESKRDDVWVVVDKDGYTKHPEAFDMAVANKINIAFSSISFEVWILCHFEFTTKQFGKSEEVIKYINDKKYFQNEFTKNDLNLYSTLIDNLKDAFTNSERLKKHHKDCNYGKKIYTLNPYTNIDDLVNELLKFQGA